MGADRRWEHFPHGADVGVRGIGPTMAVAFAQAAMAVTAAITDPEVVRRLESVDVECQAASPDDLFFDWIDTVVYHMSVRNMLFAEFDVRIDGGRLTARLWGETVDRQRHEPAVEVKGPTYTELRVGYDADTSVWTAQCIVDV